jgi:hypothetical protein
LKFAIFPFFTAPLRESICGYNEERAVSTQRTEVTLKAEVRLKAEDLVKALNITIS